LLRTPSRRSPSQPSARTRGSTGSPRPRPSNCPGATGEAEPVCAVCDGKIGIFIERGLAWRHYTGDGTTVGQQHIYDPGHTPVVTWRLAEDPQTRV
jgi:hypothetical protein